MAGLVGGSFARPIGPDGKFQGTHAPRGTFRRPPAVVDSMDWAIVVIVLVIGVACLTILLWGREQQ